MLVWANDTTSCRWAFLDWRMAYVPASASLLGTSGVNWRPLLMLPLPDCVSIILVCDKRTNSQFFSFLQIWENSKNVLGLLRTCAFFAGYGLVLLKLMSWTSTLCHKLLFLSSVPRCRVEHRTRHLRSRLSTKLALFSFHFNSLVFAKCCFEAGTSCFRVGLSNFKSGYEPF